MKQYEQLLQSADYIKNFPFSEVPKTGIILGSGLGEIADEIDGISIDYSEIPGLKKSGVEGHAGKLRLGFLASKPVVAMQGRIHYYEGNSLAEVVYPVRVMRLLGVEKLIVTNAAGSINKDFSVGNIMFISDHINFMGDNPLIGENISEIGTRFPDMTTAYNKDFINIAKQKADMLEIKYHTGVYAGMSGPSYETPAEIRMLRLLGADAVGMSTIPEVIAARHAQMEVLGISCLTNMAAGILEQQLSHSEVIETVNRTKQGLKRLVQAIIEDL